MCGPNTVGRVHKSYTFEATLLDGRIFANRLLETFPAIIVDDVMVEVFLAFHNCRSIEPVKGWISGSYGVGAA